jgi:hypothetical protein
VGAFQPFDALASDGEQPSLKGLLYPRQRLSHRLGHYERPPRATRRRHHKQNVLRWDAAMTAVQPRVAHFTQASGIA